MFNIAFIIVSILLIITILLQQKSSGLGVLMGGGEEIAQTRRGADQFLHYSTIVLSVLFFAGGFYSMFWI